MALRGACINGLEIEEFKFVALNAAKWNDGSFFLNFTMGNSGLYNRVLQIIENFLSTVGLPTYITLVSPLFKKSLKSNNIFVLFLYHSIPQNPIFKPVMQRQFQFFQKGPKCHQLIIASPYTFVKNKNIIRFYAIFVPLCTEGIETLTCYE